LGGGVGVMGLGGGGGGDGLGVGAGLGRLKLGWKGGGGVAFDARSLGDYGDVWGRDCVNERWFTRAARAGSRWARSGAVSEERRVGGGSVG